jgi:hypothetical protein
MPGGIIGLHVRPIQIEEKCPGCHKHEKRQVVCARCGYVYLDETVGKQLFQAVYLSGICAMGPVLLVFFFYRKATGSFTSTRSYMDNGRRVLAMHIDYYDMLCAWCPMIKDYIIAGYRMFAITVRKGYLGSNIEQYGRLSRYWHIRLTQCLR